MQTPTMFIASMVLTLSLVVAPTPCQAFWWGNAAREADPTPQTIVKQVPVGYIRTFTYQPLHFNPAVAQQLFTYPTLNMPSAPANSAASAAKLMVNPLQYLPAPQKYSSSSASQAAATASMASSPSSLSSSVYNGPLQAQQSVQQVTQAHEPAPAASMSASSKSGNTPPSASGSASASSAPFASIAESLTSDEHLPAARDPMPLQQQPQSQQQQQQLLHSQFQPSAPQQQQYTIVAPTQQQQQQQYSPSFGAAQPRLASAPLPPSPYANNMAASYLASSANFNDQMQQAYGSYPAAYGPAAPMPTVQMPVQFVPCMCPVSYAYSPAAAEKRSDVEQPMQQQQLDQQQQQQQQQQQSMMPALTVTDYHQMMEPVSLVSGQQAADAINANVTDDLTSV